jgi:hypothetical protein
VSQALGTGEVIVNSGAQLATDTNAVLTNPIILNSGGTLAGSGNFSPPDQLLTFAAGSTVQPGNPSLGTATAQLTFGTLGNSQVTFGSGGFYLFTVEDANGAPGTGYSTVDVSGAVTITATAEAPFTVQVAATSSQYGYAGPAANFNPTLSYSWTLLTAGSITGFDTNAFYIDPSLFAAQNSLMGGSFAVDEVNGNTLTLDFTPVPEPSTWILLLAGTALIGLGFRRRVRS